jgi:hypothetical protein
MVRKMGPARLVVELDDRVAAGHADDAVSDPGGAPAHLDE